MKRELAALDPHNKPGRLEKDHDAFMRRRARRDWETARRGDELSRHESEDGVAESSRPRKRLRVEEDLVPQNAQADVQQVEAGSPLQKSIHRSNIEDLPRYAKGAHLQQDAVDILRAGGIVPVVFKGRRVVLYEPQVTRRPAAAPRTTAISKEDLPVVTRNAVEVAPVSNYQVTRRPDPYVLDWSKLIPIEHVDVGEMFQDATEPWYVRAAAAEKRLARLSAIRDKAIEAASGSDTAGQIPRDPEEVVLRKPQVTMPLPLDPRSPTISDEDLTIMVDNAVEAASRPSPVRPHAIQERQERLSATQTRSSEAASDSNKENQDPQTPEVRRSSKPSSFRKRIAKKPLGDSRKTQPTFKQSERSVSPPACVKLTRGPMPSPVTPQASKAIICDEQLVTMPPPRDPRSPTISKELLLAMLNNATEAASDSDKENQDLQRYEADRLNRLARSRKQIARKPFSESARTQPTCSQSEKSVPPPARAESTENLVSPSLVLQASAQASSQSSSSPVLLEGVARCSQTRPQPIRPRASAPSSSSGLIPQLLLSQGSSQASSLMPPSPLPNRQPVTAAASPMHSPSMPPRATGRPYDTMPPSLLSRPPLLTLPDQHLNRSLQQRMSALESERVAMLNRHQAEARYRADQASRQAQAQRQAQEESARQAEAWRWHQHQWEMSNRRR